MEIPLAPAEEGWGEGCGNRRVHLHSPDPRWTESLLLTRLGWWSLRSRHPDIEPALSQDGVHGVGSPARMAFRVLAVGSALGARCGETDRDEVGCALLFTLLSSREMEYSTSSLVRQMGWSNQWIDVSYLLVGAMVLFLSVGASLHAITHKRDSRATLLWVAFIWLSPLVGSLFYLILGVNRIRRRAVALRGDLDHYESAPAVEPHTVEDLRRVLPREAAHLQHLAKVVTRVVDRPLLPGNRIELLVNGDAAYPAMLAAIAQAEHSVALSSYIFDNDASGRRFVAALGAAVERGVAVRVIVDDAGLCYSFPSILRVLRSNGVRVSRFMPQLALRRFVALNLRCHRKILVVDGKVGFTGGMNIRQGNCLNADPRPKYPVQDIHFRIVGPVVAQLQEAFVDDWRFCTGEALRGQQWFPPLQEQGDVIARGVMDGPDEDFEKLPWTIMAAINAARSHLQILTPYFLPDQAMIAALNLAALRGVRVEIGVPAKNNLPFIQWASAAIWWQMLQRGCRIWRTPPPFDHSKVMVVDDHWAFIGSSNLDPRSLRLNFEFNVECYGASFAAQLGELARTRLEAGQEATLEEMDGRGFPIRVRDGIARLFTPFL